MQNKLRGKRIDSGEWVYGTGITDFLNVYGPDRKGCWLWSNYGWVEVQPESVGMYLSKDAYDQEIYIGSEVRLRGYYDTRFDTQHGIVVWDEEVGSIRIDDGTEAYIPFMPRELEVINEANPVEVK